MLAPVITRQYPGNTGNRSERWKMEKDDKTTDTYDPFLSSGHFLLARVFSSAKPEWVPKRPQYRYNSKQDYRGRGT